jgi:general L-amino acid transport system permease protein
VSELPPLAQEPLPQPAPAWARPRVGARRWAAENLFNSWFNSVLTAVFAAVIAYTAVRALRFVFVSAEWDIVRVNLTNFLVGRFPRHELWRTWAAMFILAAVIGFAVGVGARLAAEQDRARGRETPPVTWQSAVVRFWPLGLLAVVLVVLAGGVVPVAALAAVMATVLAARLGGRRAPPLLLRLAWVPVVAGLVAALEVVVAFDGVGWDRWGGLLLTAFAAIGGIALAFPLGLLLALGRRSSLPAVRTVSIAYIEFFRGVPLITLLFMGVFVIGFFFPTGFERPSTLTRAMIAIVVFEAAYVAEVVRGGLQSVPRGQYEAAQAVGLSPWKVTRLIVLPQALRAVIPAMVGQFISLYKDTSLLAIVGFFELLSVAQTVTQQPDFLGRGLHTETLAFAAFVYWVGSYTMSRESQRLERRLGIGQR